MNVGRMYVSPEVKRRIVEEADAEGNAALVARRYGVSASAISKWRRQYEAGELQIEGTPSDSENTKRLVAENRELRRLVGEKDLKIKILEDMLKKTAERLHSVSPKKTPVHLQEQNYSTSKNRDHTN